MDRECVWIFRFTCSIAVMAVNGRDRSVEYFPTLICKALSSSTFDDVASELHCE